MASSGCRAVASSRHRAVAGLALLLAGLSQGAIAPAAAGTDPGIELPEGPGREILLNQCLGCHDLGGLDLFASFYTRDDWHRLVETMVAHGATVDTAGVETLADYLALNFGAD
jgi:mono/diheme cytochrome c family protein